MCKFRRKQWYRRAPVQFVLILLPQKVSENNGASVYLSFFFFFNRTYLALLLADGAGWVFVISEAYSSITANIESLGQPTVKRSLLHLTLSSTYSKYPSFKIKMSKAEFPNSLNFTLEFSRLLQAYIKNLPISFFYGGFYGTCGVFRWQLMWTPGNKLRTNTGHLKTYLYFNLFY